jgi:hypothetical protein
VGGTDHVAAAETILAAVGEEAAVGQIGVADEYLAAEENMVAVIPDDAAFVALVDLRAVLVNVSAALGAEHELVAMLQILTILHVEARFAVLAVLEVIAAAVLEIVSAGGLHDHLSLHRVEFCPEILVLRV